MFGRAVFDKPEFVSTQPLPEFFALPSRPDRRAYQDYRRYLLETSQVAGGFYSARGRRQLMRMVVDMMLSAEDPYDALAQGTAARRPSSRRSRGWRSGIGRLSAVDGLARVTRISHPCSPRGPQVRGARIDW